MSNRRGLILPFGEPLGHTRVRNVETGRVLPCCWSDCDRDGFTEYEIARDHEQPRWPGEKRIYVFCSSAHRDRMFPDR